MIKNRKWTLFPIIIIVVLCIGIIIPVHAGTTNNSAISVAVSQSTIQKGDTLHITGTATGNPSQGVAIGIFGKNIANQIITQPDSTGKFSYEINSATTSTMYRGTYYIVAQHPMQNNQFDIYLKSSSASDPEYGVVYNRLLDAPVKTDATHVFRILGAGSLQGSDAVFYLTEALKDPSIDDNYAEAQFSVLDPTATTAPISSNPTSHSYLSVTVSSSEDLLSGTSTSASFQIDYDEIFPRYDSLQFVTELNNPKWSYTIILNNEELSHRDIYSQDLLIPGFELEYPSDVKVTVKATLTGTAPSDNLPKKIIVLRVQQKNSQNELLSVYDAQRMVKETGSTIPATTPTTYVTTVSSTIPTTSPTTNVITTIATPIPTSTIDYDATIAALQSQIDEQNAKIEEQGNWIDAILRFLGLK